jgi:hypothetical protein
MIKILKTAGKDFWDFSEEGSLVLNLVKED